MIHCVPNCPCTIVHVHDSFESIGRRSTNKDWHWLACTFSSLWPSDASCYHQWWSHALHAPAAACLHQMTGAGPHLALSSSSSCAPETRSPVACWPPLHHHWSEQAAQEAGFGDDDPTRGWEGRGDLQQRQCRSDTEPRQHLSGGTIFSRQIPRFFCHAKLYRQVLKQNCHFEKINNPKCKRAKAQNFEKTPTESMLGSGIFFKSLCHTCVHL